MANPAYLHFYSYPNNSGNFTFVFHIRKARALLTKFYSIGIIMFDNVLWPKLCVPLKESFISLPLIIYIKSHKFAIQVCLNVHFHHKHVNVIGFSLLCTGDIRPNRRYRRVPNVFNTTNTPTFSNFKSHLFQHHFG